MQRRPFHSRAAFTLLELLAVVAIIVILLTIVIPTVGAIRRTAQTTVCQANLRQWGVALHLFANDSKQRYIPYEGSADYISWGTGTNGVSSAANTKAWFNVLPPYVSQIALLDLPNGFGKSLTSAQKLSYFRDQKLIYACPSDARPSLDVSTYINPSFLMNSQLYNSDGPSGTKDGPNTAGGGRLLTLHDFDNLQYPLARIAFLADAGADNYAGDRPRTRGHGDRNSALQEDRYSGVDARHRGYANILFMDGSVRSYTSEELNRPYTDPGSVVWLPW